MLLQYVLVDEIGGSLPLQGSYAILRRRYRRSCPGSGFVIPKSSVAFSAPETASFSNFIGTLSHQKGNHNFFHDFTQS